MREVDLNSYLAECRKRRFRPGVHDCATFVAGWVKKATGTDYARGWRGKYRSIRKGEALLKGAGHADHIALAAAHLEQTPAAFAQTGDLAVIEGRALGIVSAERVFVLRPDGLGHVSLSKAERAFRV